MTGCGPQFVQRKEMARRSLKGEMYECEFNAAVDEAQRTMASLKPEPLNLGKSESSWDAYIAEFARYKEKASGCVIEEYQSYYALHVRRHIERAQEYGVDLESNKGRFAYLSFRFY